MRARAVAVLAFLAVAALCAAPPGAQARCSITYAQLPVTMAGRMPLARARINGHDAPFLIDSGAFHSLIGPGFAAQLHLPLAPLPGYVTKGMGGEVTPSLAIVDAFELGGTTTQRAQFLVGGAEITHAAGVIGQNFLHKEDMEYDLADGYVRFVRASGCPGAEVVYWASPMPASSVDLTPIDEVNATATTAIVEVDGHQLKAQFDTGAPWTLISLAAARRLGFDPDAPGVAPLGNGHGLGASTFRIWRLAPKTVRIGGEEIRDARLRVSESGVGEVEMLIGADFFLAHHVYVSNAQRMIYFTANGRPIFDGGVAQAPHGAAPSRQITDDPHAPGRGSDGRP